MEEKINKEAHLNILETDVTLLENKVREHGRRIDEAFTGLSFVTCEINTLRTEVTRLGTIVNMFFLTVARLSDEEALFRDGRKAIRKDPQSFIEIGKKAGVDFELYTILPIDVFRQIFEIGSTLFEIKEKLKNFKGKN